MVVGTGYQQLVTDVFVVSHLILLFAAMIAVFKAAYLAVPETDRGGSQPLADTAADFSAHHSATGFSHCPAQSNYCPS